MIREVRELVARPPRYHNVIVARGYSVGGIDQFAHRSGHPCGEDQAENDPDEDGPASHDKHGPHCGMSEPLRAVAPGDHCRLIQFQQAITTALDRLDVRLEVFLVVGKRFVVVGPRQLHKLREVEHVLVILPLQFLQHLGLARNCNVVLGLR